jgi:hypothetical protein
MYSEERAVESAEERRSSKGNAPQTILRRTIAWEVTGFVARTASGKKG